MNKGSHIRVNTTKADELANLYWKTRDEKYKILWYQEVKRLSQVSSEEQ
jgi:hypothetical protein